MSEWDTTALLSDIKERGSLPDNDLRFTSALLLASATRELRDGVAPMLVNARSEHLVYPYSQDVVSGTRAYRMPTRAVGGALRKVLFLAPGQEPIPLNQLSADEGEQRGSTQNSGTPCSYWLQGYRLVLVPSPNLTGTLSTPYYARPNALVLPAATVVAADVTYLAGPGSVEIIVNTDPPDALQVSQRIDVVRATPGFETLAANADAEVEDLGGGLWAFRFGLSEDPGIAPGDYVCMPGQAPVPQVPVELHGLLAVRAARRAMKAVGDDRWQALADDVAELEDKAKDWLAPRVSGDTQQAGGSIGQNGLVGGLGWMPGW